MPNVIARANRMFHAVMLGPPDSALPAKPSFTLGNLFSRAGASGVLLSTTEHSNHQRSVDYYTNLSALLLSCAAELA